MWAGFPGAATLRLCCPHACPSFLLAIVSCMRQPPSHPIEQDAELYHLACGGASLPDQLLADQAERCRMIVGREEQVDMLAADPSQIDSVVAMQVSAGLRLLPTTTLWHLTFSSPPLLFPLPLLHHHTHSLCLSSALHPVSPPTLLLMIARQLLGSRLSLPCLPRPHYVPSSLLLCQPSCPSVVRHRQLQVVESAQRW